MSAESCRHAVWTMRPVDDGAVASLARELGLSRTVARVLAARGYADPTAARAFLEPALARDWRDPELIAGMPQVAERVAAAVRGGERIVVFGDFDLDGVSSAAVATLGLAALGADVRATVPHRFREGYGLTQASIERLAGMEPQLVVTVDCGISSAREVAWLAERGIDTVVTDHHEPGDDVPDALVADPKLRADDDGMLAGAGVALKLVQAVGARLGRPDVWRELTDLAMLGTVADVVPLVGENRALVCDGVLRTRRAPRPGVTALAEVAGTEIGMLTAERVAFALAPRLNAAGRMADPALALELLLTDDPTRATALALELDACNEARRSAEATLMAEALAQAQERFRPGDRAVVVAGEGWHEGVRGIVASRLVERFGVPALVFTFADGEARGSGRSVAGVDLHAAVASLGGILTRFGGHAAAVGVTLPAAGLPALREGLEGFLRTLPAEAFVASLTVDAEVGLDEASIELAAELARLAPFGHGNPAPLLATRGVFMNGRSRVGKNAEHLRFLTYDGVSSVPAIYFRCPTPERLAASEQAVDVAFELVRDTWRGAERVQLRVADVTLHTAAADEPAAELVDDLFEHADEILAENAYAGIGEADAFHTKLVGVTFEDRQALVAALAPGDPLRLSREPDEAHDPAACALVDAAGRRVGYLARELAAVLAPAIDAGVDYDVTVVDVTGADKASLGVNVLVRRRRPAEVERAAERSARSRRSAMSALDETALSAELARVMLGGREPHAAQTAALAALAAGRSLLAVMATGRGKSFVFHLHAARIAIARHEASVFVYPLRALVADQELHLADSLRPLGVNVRTLTGETPPLERDEAFSALAHGDVDVVLTTPEFLVRHAARFAESGRVRFVAIDEAHHAGMTGTDRRPAYAALPGALETLGDPVTLATTATADDVVAERILRTLATRLVVVDPAVRGNLRLADQRGCPDKAAYVAGVVARGGKTIVYVNSRKATVDLARQLRDRVPALRHRVAFYNGGLTRSARHAVERALRDDELAVVVATSAFGEGVDIPDVRNVVLFHLPFNAVAFNQTCGRAGRDGAPATVHLVYAHKDTRLDRMILESAAPDRDDMAALYLAIRDLAATGGTVEAANAVIAEAVSRRRPSTRMDERGVSAGIGVFRELGLVESEGVGAYRRLRLLPVPEDKLDLVSSVRYAEGREQIGAFEEFSHWALTAPADVLLSAFDRPILPTRHIVEGGA